jgi:hypothetical protein
MFLKYIQNANSMELKEKVIRRIIFSIDKNQFDDETLHIDVNLHEEIRNNIILNKVNTVNDVNIYENSCSIKGNYSDTIIIKLEHNYFNDLLKGNGQIYIIDDDVDYNHVNDIIEDDVNYNHVNDICGNIYNPKEYELSYSVYYNFYNTSAVTLFIDPLKYPSLVSLVLFEFLTNNDYPQDLKNLILSYYNDV